MSYNDNLLLEIQCSYVILGLLTATIIGSVGCIIWLFLNKGTAKFYVKDAMKFLKLILSSFLMPIIPFVLFPIFKRTGGVAGSYMVNAMVRILAILIIIWLISVLVMIVRRIVNYAIACRMCADSIPVEDEGVLMELEHWKERLQFHKRISLSINPNISSPAVLYHRGYQILLPAYEMSEKQMSMAILHEMVHLKHKDLLTKNVCFFVQAIHGLNPLARRIKDEVIRWAEVLCDLTTCEVGREHFTRQEYYYSIYQLMEHTRKEMRNDAVFSLSESKSLLEFRVHMFAESNKTGQNRLKGMFRLMLFLMLGATTLFFGVTVAATEVWYEVSLSEEKEDLDLVYMRTSAYNEMFSGVENIQEESICTIGIVEKEIVLDAGEAFVFVLDDGNFDRIDVHLFVKSGSGVMGGIKENGEIEYTKGSGILAKGFFREDGIDRIFIINKQSTQLSAEVCMEVIGD